MRPYWTPGQIRHRIAWSGTALLLILLATSTVAASEFTLRVDGLACPFCAFGVEKKLLKVPGVAGINVLIDEGKIVLELAEGARLDVGALNTAVEKAGFTLRGLLVQDALGTLSRNGGDELLLTCSDPRVTFRVKFAEEDAPPGAHPGGQVYASGSVTDFESLPTELIVARLTPLRDTSRGDH